MDSQNHQPTGFFPNLLSVVVFIVIMVGMFLGFTRVYPDLIEMVRNGEQTPTVETPSVAQDIAPFVRGVITGISAAQFASTRSNEPLNVVQIKGFQEGIKTALLSSKNWYNIDQQLFRTRGIALGVTAAVESSKSERARGTQGYQVQLAQQIEAALATNLEEILANRENREKILRDYLENLKRLSGEASIEIANMQRVIEEAQSVAQTQTGIAEEYDQDFIYNLEPTDDKGLEAYLRARNQLDQASVTIRSTGQRLNRLGPLYTRLNQLITAVEANFQALSTGTRVAPVQGVNLPIFQE